MLSQVIPESVLQPWVTSLPWKQQSILLSGLRGPDDRATPAAKAVGRWIRTVSQQNADPSKNYMRQEPLPSQQALCDELEFMTCHFVHHFADALAVIAYAHPDSAVARSAAEYHYRIAEELFHFVPETASTFWLRHRDKPGGNDPKKGQWKSHEAVQESDYLDAALSRFR